MFWLWPQNSLSDPVGLTKPLQLIPGRTDSDQTTERRKMEEASKISASSYLSLS